MGRVFFKTGENQFSCSRPRVAGLLNICTRLLYPIKPKMQYIRNFELTFRSRQNSVFYFPAETSGKLHRRTEWAEYFSKQAENQFSCSRPRVTGLLNICTRLLYPIKPKTVFKIIWGRGATPHFKVVQFFMNLAENFSRLLKHPIWGDLKNSSL